MAVNISSNTAAIDAIFSYNQHVDRCGRRKLINEVIAF